MRPTVEIISQGDEVLEGMVIDTNAAWLSLKLTDLGFRVIRKTCVGDDLDAITSLLADISKRADICISTGGLGPTIDDLTAEAASRAFGLPLIEDPEALNQIRSWFQRSGRVMPRINERQALLPESSDRIDNLWGTAPGFSILQGCCRFFFLPGVPREMTAMFESSVVKNLSEHFQPLQRGLVTFHTVGLGESTLQERLNDRMWPEGTRLGFRAKGTENEVKLSLPERPTDQEIQHLIGQVRPLLGEALYSVVRDGTGPENLTEFVGNHLRDHEVRILVHESLSKGTLSAALAQQRVQVRGEIQPCSNPPAPVETDALIEHQLTSLAEHLVRKQDIDCVLLERWYPEDDESPAARTSVVFWILAANETSTVVEKHTLRGSLEQLSQAALTWSLNALRKVHHLDITGQPTSAN
jgi:nicotinamide-nucleotide amidase